MMKMLCNLLFLINPAMGGIFLLWYDATHLLF